MRDGMFRLLFALSAILSLSAGCGAMQMPQETSRGKEAPMRNIVTGESIVRISRIEVEPAHLPEYLSILLKGKCPETGTAN